MSLRTVEFKATFWSFEEDMNDYTKGMEIHITGITEDQKSVYCRVMGFTPYVYLELPSRVAWNKNKAQTLYEYIQTNICRSSGPPLGMECVKKKKLRGCKEYAMLKLYFPTQMSIMCFAKKIATTRTGFYIDDLCMQLNSGDLAVHEQNFDPIIKFTARNSIQLAGWISAKEMVLPEDRGVSIEDRAFSRADIDLYANYKNVLPIEKGMTLIHRKYLNFDIETYSKNHDSKLPDSSIPENVIFQIGISINRKGYQRSKRKRILLTLFNPHDIENVQVIRCKTEKELILKFRDIIIDEDPDIFEGYNIMKFDWDYIVKRASMLGILNHFFEISRMLTLKARLGKIKWHSSAYGDQEFEYVFCPGRLNMDIFLEVERTYKLPKYNLNTVAQFFLKESKDDITPRQLFMLYKLTKEMLSYLTSLSYNYIPRHERVDIKLGFIDILPKRQCHGVVLNLRKKLLAAKTRDEMVYWIRQGLTLTGKYCIQDVEVTENIEEKLNLEKSMEEMSNCTCVPMSYLHTRGQQVKAQGQFYRETIKNNIVIPYHKTGSDFVRKKYQGAIVLKVRRGYHKHVAIFDFESLYPSCLIDNNICYTTLIEDDSVPDSECNVLEWDEHIACEHDPMRRKAKKDGTNVLCGHHRYRFRKVVILPDGTRLNEGILPKLERHLMSTRKCIKKEMAREEAKLKMTLGLAEPEDIEFYKKMGWEIISKGYLTDAQVEVLRVCIVVLNARQNAMKISANSIYGITGAQQGFAPLVEGASSITYYGRTMITRVIEFIERTEPTATIVYGDSVTFDTPILTKLNDKIAYYNIQDIPNQGWFTRRGKDFAIPADGLQVWSDKGFTQIKYLIRHKTEKDIYRVLTHTGVVDVTQDHSLLDVNGKKISPLDISIGDGLLHADLPKANCSNIELEKSVYTFEKKYDAAVFIQLITNLGYSFRLGMDEVNNFIEVHISKNYIDLSIIRSIQNIGKTDNFVYDLETENHHFSAGVGKLVVHNTDSVMVKFDGKNTAETFEYGDMLAKKITHYLKCMRIGVNMTKKIKCKEDKQTYTLDKFPRNKMNGLQDTTKILIHSYDACPINLQFENLYDQKLLLTKKRYLAFAVNRKGEIISEVKKGVVLTRRDNCAYLRDVYKLIAVAVLKETDLTEILYIIYDNVHKLFTRQIPDTKLIIYMGVKKLKDYAKKKKNTSKFVDKDGNILDDDIDADDERLVYTNIPQVLLLKKMIGRGEIVPPNSRLEFLYIENENAIKQGEKAEDYTFYKENKSEYNFRPDYIHYVEKQLERPLTEILNVITPLQIVPYEPIEEKVKKLLSQVDSMTKDIIESQKKVFRKGYLKSIEERQGKPNVGWYVKCKKCRGKKCKFIEVVPRLTCAKCEKYPTFGTFKNQLGTRCAKHRKEGMVMVNNRQGRLKRIENIRHTGCCEPKEYIFRGFSAQVQFIIDSAKRNNGKIKDIDDIDPEKCQELVEACKSWKSRNILDRLYKQHGLKKRPVKRPSQTGAKLRLVSKEQRCQVVLLTKISRYNKGTIATLVDIKEHDVETTVKKDKKAYTYDLEFDTGEILHDVPRNQFTTFRYKDSTIVKDIRIARACYKSVIEEFEKSLVNQIIDYDIMATD